MGGSGNTSFSERRMKRPVLIAVAWVLVPLGVLLGVSAVIPAPPPSPGDRFDVEVEVSPAAIRSGQETLARVTVRNLDDRAFPDAVIDVEVHKDGRMVFQRYVEGRDFGPEGSPGTEQRVDALWTPGAPGKYVLKVGVFNADWSRMHHWADAAASLDVR
jgi:hypothetical protein